MYSIFESWEAATGAALRIYDPFAYRPALYTRMVPVCLSETLALAERWPVLWRRDAHGDPDLVVLRGLHPQHELPEAHGVSRTALPLLVQAFPFRFRDPTAGGEIGLERGAPMRERDAGSYIISETGELLPGAELKLRALEAWEAERALRHDVTAAVFRHGLLEPVRLPGDLSARFGLPDFMVVVPHPDDSLIFGAIDPAHWRLVAQFLAAQRLSLYTMARLIALTEGAA
ncbi:SapC family protein [Gemmobacter serpentinus]|uniref:SapC family protein n=1 Tax=Gemmobacter serpentinus TaxID=2652247 RepID=UPI00124EB970|nr:SapC family protein [Gemmobacter serpentinus]